MTIRAVVLSLLVLLAAGCASASVRPPDLADLGVVDAARLIRAKVLTSALARSSVMKALRSRLASARLR